MGLMDSFINAMKIDGSDEDDMYTDDGYFDEEDVVKEKKVSNVTKMEDIAEKKQSISRMSPFRQQKKVSA